jgi:hypothetical protein
MALAYLKWETAATSAGPSALQAGFSFCGRVVWVSCKYGEAKSPQP